MDLKIAFLKDFKLWLCFIGTGSFKPWQLFRFVLFGVNDDKLFNTKLSERKLNKQIDSILLGSSSSRLFLIIELKNDILRKMLDSGQYNWVVLWMLLKRYTADGRTK